MTESKTSESIAAQTPILPLDTAQTPKAPAAEAQAVAAQAARASAPVDHACCAAGPAVAGAAADSPTEAPAKPAPKRRATRKKPAAKKPTAAETEAEAKKQAEAERAAAELAERKDAVRHEVVARRQQLRAGERSSRSRKICNQLLSYLQNSGIKPRNGRPVTVAVYAALRFEVDLDHFIRGAYAFGYRLVFPCLVPKDCAAGTMCMRSVSCLNYIGGSVPFIVDPRKPWGPAVTEEHQAGTTVGTGSDRRFIPSRVKGSIPPKDDTRFPVVSPNEIDLAVIPLVAFDEQGNRLGYGTGSYDRYLPQLQDTCHVVGVAFDEQRVDEVPHAEHDAVLKTIITA